MSEQLDVTFSTVLTVVIVSVTIYLVAVALTRIWGARGLTNLSSVDFAALAAMGAIIGRTALLENPTLIKGVVALMTIYSMRLLIIWSGRYHGIDRILHREPVVLVRSGIVLTDHLRRAHLHDQDLRLALRRVGVTQLSEVDLAVRERDGSISILRGEAKGADPWLVSDLTGL